ncbi:MAG: hypothetical protein K6F86_06040 [Lachnospiraceae bacterium]|nr:hypothetical protein [Lachnospiraceae bacterium]
MKKGFAGDEVYSYATANSSEAMSPLVDMDGTLHINEWLTPGRLFQAVVVSEDEVFNYAHINEILRYDAHPPLYFYILHFLCSFFINSFSWIPSIIINSLSIFVGQIFFYRLFLLLSENRLRSLLAMIFFGSTTAIINLMTFARNYTLQTSLTLIFLYYIFKAMRQHSLNEKTSRSILFAALFLYLASLTQYLSVLFGFFVTLSICIYYLFKKDIRFLLNIGLSMTGAIVLMIMSFHHVINQLMSDQTAMENATDFPYPLEIRISIHILFDEIFGIKTPVSPTMLFFWIFWGFATVFVICLILWFLFRADEWFISLHSKLRKNLNHVIFKLKKQRVVQYFILLFSVTILILIISYKFKMYFYHPNSNRYLFFLYPYAAIIFLVPVFALFKFNLINALLIIGLSCSSLIYGTKTNIGPSELPMREAIETFTDSDVLVFTPDHYTANASTFYLEKCNQVFYTTKGTFFDNKDTFKIGLSKNKPLYLLYFWPAYNNQNAKSELFDLLKVLQENGITTMDVEGKNNHGAQLIAGVGGHVLLRLR